MTTTDLLFEAQMINQQIDQKNPHIQIGTKIFDSHIDKLTIIVAGQKHGHHYNEVLQFNLHNDKPCEFLKFINDYTTRLISEKAILQHQLNELQSKEGFGISKIGQ